MTIEQFIEDNRTDIDAAIYAAVNRHRKTPMVYRIDDDERRLWILNDEALYSWAREEGVEI